MSGKTFELTGLRNNGTEISLEISISPWRNQGTPYFTAMLREITECDEAGHLLQDANKALEKRAID